MKYILILIIGILGSNFVGFHRENGSLVADYIFTRMWPLVLTSVIIVALLFKYYSYRWVKILSVIWIIIMAIYVYALAYV